jgi:hypothetical protein
LIAFTLYAVGYRPLFAFVATGHPQNEPVTGIIVSHLRGAVQSAWAFEFGMNGGRSSKLSVPAALAESIQGVKAV